jgi:heptosyltransferase-2
MKLLVRTTNWLGDAVMSIPALREIRGAFPGWEITLLARPWVADLYAREDFCDHIVRYENNGLHHGLSGKWKLAAQLRQTRFDCAVLLQNAFEAALLALLARIPRRIGYARDARGPLLTQAVPVPAKGRLPPHERFYYLELLRGAGLIDKLPDCPDIRLSGAGRATESGWEEWRRRKLTAKRWVGVSPGAAYGGAKRWLPERFAEAASALASELDAGIAIFGSNAEAELCGRIAQRVGPRAHNIAGTTSLAEFIDLAATCTVYLTNDSGPMHVAAALGVPTVAVFGATDHIATGPVSKRARVVREPVDCSPCFLRECPIDHRCMERVPSSKVIDEALSLLSDEPPSP